MSQHERSLAADSIASKLFTTAQYLLVGVFGLLPIFFVPSVAAPFGYSKILFVVVGILLALVVCGFAFLRSGAIRVQFAWPSILLFVIAFIALVSALLSGDFNDALVGDGFGVHTTLFIALMALTASVWTLLGTNKMMIMQLFILIAASTILLAIFHVARLVLGADVLSLGFFGGNATLSPFGGWNDLAIFFGLAIILALVALEQLPLTRGGQALFGVVTAVALVMLAVINFTAVWAVLGLVSLAVLVYGLTKDRFALGHTEAGARVSIVSIIAAIVVFLCSVLFMLLGGVLGSSIGQAVNISYTEVRPSFTATTDIIGSVYSDGALFGVGPNRFEDAWRLHKDPSINTSVFWNTDFTAGFGYIPTAFATMGLVGGVAWLAFFGVFIATGLRMLLKTASGDRTWYFIGTVSFTGGLFLWFMSILYVPGPTLLLMAALCTGLAGAASIVLLQSSVPEIRGDKNRRMGFVFVAIFLLLVIASVGSLYYVGRHYSGVYSFNRSLQMIGEGSDIDALEQRTVQAYALAENDAYVRRL
ncbi:MAG: hypothetical protein WC966_12270, partial [Bradymonadales bacterium]